MRIIDRGLALLRLATRHPQAVFALRRWRPFSITSFEIAHALKAQGIEPATVIDAGANVGQFARAMAETFPSTVVLSFEPLPPAAKQLRANLGDHPRVQLFEMAVGNRDGQIAFHPQRYDLASSVLPPVQSESDDSGLEPISVAITRLDTALRDRNLVGPILLKLDLQGYELEGLRGADDVLSRVRWVLLETGFRQHYVGEPLFEEVFDFLRERGFRFLRPVDILRGDHAEIVQMDALFERGGDSSEGR